MISKLKKTLVREISVRVNKDEYRRAVIYLQPDGLLVLRWSKGRKRYGISIAEVFTRAMQIGPLDGIFAGLLDGKARPKRMKRGNGNQMDGR